jgi:hypothetical protein
VECNPDRQLDAVSQINSELLHLNHHILGFRAAKNFSRRFAKDLPVVPWGMSWEIETPPPARSSYRCTPSAEEIVIIGIRPERSAAFYRTANAQKILGIGLCPQVLSVGFIPSHHAMAPFTRLAKCITPSRIAPTTSPASSSAASDGNISSA